MTRAYLFATTFTLLLASNARADEPAAEAQQSAERKVWDNYSIRLGLESAGPVLFRDTPDGRIENTSVFQFGGHLAFLFGHERKDFHRFGLALAFNQVAKSDTRKLRFLDPYLVYETGHPLMLQVGLGASIATGTSSFADEYGGLFGLFGLRYSFTREGRDSIVSVSPGLVAKSYLVTSDVQNSSFFVGAQVEIAYSTNK